MQFHALLQGYDSIGMGKSFDFDIIQAVKAWIPLYYTCIIFDENASTRRGNCVKGRGVYNGCLRDN